VPADLSKARELFLHAVGKLPSEQWDAYIAEASGGDADVERQVRHMLRVHADAGSFLERPAELPPATGDSETVSADAGKDHRNTPGTILGRYKLLEEIGEGGMGTVWMAQQTEPVKRLVAVKLIKAGMDSRQVIARFEAERQALALMDHPNIARVLDGGTTEAGRPYFVMDLVKGVPITKYCDDHHLTPRQRLELFLPVCQAVQHAHQKGIIHRDLKPSNVLVAQYDGKPVPKVIDFGVAKAAGQQLTDKTLVTGFGNIVGTLEYMSPEQAEINQLDIDTRSDIYSLGVLLYELLAGSPPFSKKDLEKAGMLEMLRVIREQEPSKPSTKLSSSDALPTLSANRGTEPAKLTKLVRGELDWIVMKALEKDRSRRYETANGFAMDVQRYLADEAVQACPPSASYRVRKFARRNKVGLAVAALVLFFLVLMGSGAGWVWRDRAARAADRANHLERAVERAELLQREGKRGEALAALERALLLAREAEPAAPLVERIKSLEQVLDAEGRDEAFVAQFEAIRHEVQTEVDVVKNDFSPSKGYPKIRAALEQYGIAVGVSPPVAAATHIQKRPAAIQTVVVAALDECLRYVPREDSGTIAWLYDVLKKADSDPWRNKVRRSWKQQATLEARAKEIEVRQQPPSFLLLVVKALPIKSPSRLELARRVQFAYPGDFWANHELGMVLHFVQKDAEAARIYTAALALRPDNPGVFVNRSLVLKNLGELEASIGDLRRAIAVAPRYAAAYINLGHVLLDQKKPDEAIAEFRKAIELGARKPGAHIGLGNALWHKGQADEAIAEYRKAIELDPKFARAHTNLGVVLSHQGKLDEAIACYRKAIDLDPELVWAHNGLGAALQAQGKLDEAIAEYRKAIALDPKLAIAYEHLGWALQAQKKLDEAIACYRRAIELDPKSDWTRNALGHALLEKGQLDDAIAAWRKAIEIDPKNALAHYNVARAYALLGQWGRAAAHTGKQILLCPSDNVLWMTHACFLLRADDTKGYRLACQEMIDKFGQTKNPIIAHRVAWTCFLMPDAVSDQKLLMELAQRSVDGAPEDPWTGITLGLAFYRAGQFEKAVKKLQPYAEIGWCQIQVSLILAMAQERLGKTEEARRLLDKGVKQMEIEVAAKVRGPLRQMDNAHSWAAYEILRGEAEKVLKK
jgi:tetratricopeptide (TPR) repeat protein